MSEDWNSITVDRYWDRQGNTSNDIGIGILDISRDISSSVVQKRCFDMTYFYINRMVKMGICKYLGFENTVEKILESADNAGKKYCLIACQGNLLFRGPTIINLTLKYIEENPDFFVIGHIIDKQKQKSTTGIYPGLHRQYLFVNIEKWRALGSPKFDEIGYFKDRKPVLANYECSQDTCYANYTPAYIKGLPGEQEYTETSDGSNWIDIACRNDIRIDNLTDKMRDCKVFLYPYSDSEILEKVWYNKQSPLVDKITNQSQKAWIRKLGYQEEIEKDRVYAFNTEILSGEGIRSQTIDHFFSVAAGFKPLAILNANGFHEKTTVTYFDWCEASLNYKRHLLETWDGVDLHKWLLEHDLRYNFSSTYRGTYEEFWIQEVNEHGGPEAFKNLWDRYRKLEHNFCVIDIVNNPELLFDKVNKCIGNKVMWTTNIWSSEMLHWNVEPEVLEQKWINFEKLVPNDLVLYGHDYMGVDINQRVRNNARTTHPRFQTLYSSLS